MKLREQYWRKYRQNRQPIEPRKTAIAMTYLVVMEPLPMRLIRTRTTSTFSKSVYRRQNRFWPGTHTDIIRQVHPTNRAGRIHEEFRGARDVFAFCAALGMQHSVPTDRLSLGIGKKWKSIVSGLAELL
jgi:hypothetical protein